MKTSESYTNLQQISPETTGTLGAGTMSSRSRPVTGVVLLEEVQESGKKTAPTVSAELVLDGGVAATATFDAQYPLNRGMFYDVEVRGKGADGAFLQVASLPDGKTIADVGDSFFTKKVFSTSGRFGAYGAPTDIKVVNSDKGTRREVEVTFSALSPSQTEVPRRTLGFGQAEPLHQRRFRLPDGEEQADQSPAFGNGPLIPRFGEQFHHPELRIARAHAQCGAPARLRGGTSTGTGTFATARHRYR